MATAVCAGAGHYFLTGGASGWTPLVAALFGVGGGIAFRLLLPALWSAPRAHETSIPNDEEAFRLNPGAGRIAARLILKQQGLDHAFRIFDLFKSEPHKSDEAAPYAALACVLLTHDRHIEASDLLLEVSGRVPSPR